MFFTFRFPLEGRKSCLQSLRRLLGVTSSSWYLLVGIIFYENQDGICFLWDLGLWILTIQPSHSYTLAYCRPIYLISIEFQNIENNQGSLPKKHFLPLQLLSSCNPWGHFDWDFFYKLIQRKVEDLTVGSRKTSFHFDHWPTCQ
jgi:hypothetical protein